ncbi:MAG: TetR/AcrR family transcriptional regulator, partial [Ruminococcus sp.]
IPTIDDISKSAGYSRRTIYAYYESKEDILHHIIRNGLILLKDEVEKAIEDNSDFIQQYNGICRAMYRYQWDCPCSVENVNKFSGNDADFESISDTVKDIFALGTEINQILERFIEKGKNDGIVRQDVVPLMTVYVLWSGITSLIDMVNTKGKFLCKQFSTTEEEFLKYGFRQIINGIV